MKKENEKIDEKIGIVSKIKQNFLIVNHWQLNIKISFAAVWLYLSINKYANCSDGIFPSMRTLMESRYDRAFSHRHIQRLLAELVTSGAITIIYRSGETNLYIINDPIKVINNVPEFEKQQCTDKKNEEKTDEPVKSISPTLDMDATNKKTDPGHGCHPPPDMDVHPTNTNNTLQIKLKKNNARNGISACSFFDDFWDTVKNKTGKKNTLLAWNKIKPDKELAETIINALKNQQNTQYNLSADDKWAPRLQDPERWLKNRRWEDEPQNKNIYSNKIQIKKIEEKKEERMSGMELSKLSEIIMNIGLG